MTQNLNRMFIDNTLPHLSQYSAQGIIFDCLISYNVQCKIIAWNNDYLAIVCKIKVADYDQEEQPL